MNLCCQSISTNIEKYQILLKVGKCRSEKLSRWETVAMGKCRVGNRLLGNCRGGKLSWWEIISWEIVGWETVEWEFVEWETVEWEIVVSKI